MPLSGLQISELSQVLEEQWTLPRLTLLATDLGVDLAGIAPQAGSKESAVRFITAMNSARPPRDGELLEALCAEGNAAIRRVANRLLLPPFFSPTADTHDAVTLGKAAFVDRAELRRGLREFTTPNENSTRVLVIRGDRPGGKSYSWEYLRHLARTSVGATAHRLTLADGDYSPATFVEALFHLLDLDVDKLAGLLDEERPSRITALMNTFKGQLCRLDRPYWLVIDDLNHHRVTPAVRETAYAAARAVEDSRPENLWIALLGYNCVITDPELRLCARDEARFPSAELLAEYFQLMADAGPTALTPLDARQYADAMLAKFPDLTKEDMMMLTPLIHTAGENLRQGLRV